MTAGTLRHPSFAFPLRAGDRDSLEELARRARRDALAMTTAASSGHIGGALSSIDIFTVLWACAEVSPDRETDPGRDRIVVSHGHTAAAVYAVLGNLGWFPVEEAIGSFREAGSIFEGHPSAHVRGIEWASGSLGQGLSVGCGLALAALITGCGGRVFVVMGDGEQQKGQITEAAEFAAKHRLGNLVAVIDANGLQATGSTAEVMPVDIAARYRAAGWHVQEVDGHSFAELHEALRPAAGEPGTPRLVIARTTMGSGVSFIEGRYEYHGKVLEEAQLPRALGELGFASGPGSPGQSSAGAGAGRKPPRPPAVELSVTPGAPRTYAAGESVDCRSAFGAALLDIADANPGRPMAVLDCDLAPSVKTDAIRQRHPGRFIECGIQENNAASVAAALSSAGVLAVLAEFGVFGFDEVWGQHRMSDFNPTSLKAACTHCGLDVGEDGKTHQCIDWVSLPANLFSYRLVVPADANQADRLTRFVATTPGNFFLAMGRSKVPVLTAESGEPLFGPGWIPVYGRADWVREGDAGTIVTCGTMVHRAVAARALLASRGLRVGVLNLTCPLALDEEALGRAAATGLVVTYEDHNVRTGIGSMVAAHFQERGLAPRFRRLGVSRPGGSGTPDDLYRLQSLDPASLARAVEEARASKH